MKVHIIYLHKEHFGGNMLAANEWESVLEKDKFLFIYFLKVLLFWSRK